MAQLELRPYQREAVDGLWEYFNEMGGHPLIVIPTAGGKSLVIATILREAIGQYSDTRILVLQHVKELLVQNFQELIGIWPDAPAGMYSAAVNRRDLRSQIIFGGIQSIHKHAYKLQRVDLVLVDEAHLIPRTQNTLYRKFLGELLQINPYMKVIGLTATHYRLDSGLLHEGDDAMFSDIAYEAKIKDLIDAGYLCQPVTQSGDHQIDTSGVGTRAGEFNAGQLEKVATDPDTVNAIADEIIAAGADRRGALVFGTGVEHCKMLRDALVARGRSSECIFGETANGDRDRFIREFKAQRLWSLVSCVTLTTGFNARHVDLVAVVKPTKSLGLWIQIVGRGFRLFPGKENFLVMDFGGNIARHGPIDNPTVRGKYTRPDEDAENRPSAPTKSCINAPTCQEVSPISASECEACGAMFPGGVSLVSTKAAQFVILTTVKPPEWVDVRSVAYRMHSKPGKPDSMCVIYGAGLSQFREWICFNHTGYARGKAVSWWQKRAPGAQVPNTTAEALANTDALTKPTRILVRPQGKFFEIVGAAV
jgi:DNA repair protein RadD